ncbi:MAG: HU family DNA-binding protein [Chloroflexi bacterium]|nr:HU family DNA-binding protein [Chloroflexota bacterium]
MRQLDGDEAVGVATFVTRSRSAPTGRNPRTGEAVSISESTSPTFRAGKTLKDAVNAGARSLL